MPATILLRVLLLLLTAALLFTASASATVSPDVAAAKRAYVISSGPLTGAHLRSGFATWYGGPCDTGDEGHKKNGKVDPKYAPASGIPNTVPGIATGGPTKRGRAGLKQWFGVYDPFMRKTLVVQQTDVGPGKYRSIAADINYSAAKLLGYHVTRKKCVQGFPSMFVRFQIKAFGTQRPPRDRFSAPIGPVTPYLA